MSVMWKKSDLIIGEMLRIPHDLFIEGERALKRLTGVYYVGESRYGIIVDCCFQPSFGTTEPDKYHYKKLINWSSIYCGHVRVYREDGTMLRAYYKSDLRTSEEIVE